MKNDTWKSALIGLGIGLGPLAVATIFFYTLPLLVEGNAGSLGSFAVLILYVLGCIGGFIVSITLMTRNQTIKGAAALTSLFLQGMVLFFLLAY